MPQSSPSEQPNYQHRLSEIWQRIRAAQYQALKAVNQELIALFWDLVNSPVLRKLPNYL